MTRYALLSLSLLLIQTGCVTSGPQSIDTSPQAKPLQQVRVLTYNTLHGLAVGRYSVHPGESQDERTARLALQADGIARVAPDLVLLQEVNPLPDMAEWYVRRLKELGFAYNEVHQVDACGVRLAPGLAVVPGLNNGLVVLAKVPLRIRKLEGLKLSGGIGGCRDSMGVQFGELRYALVAEVENPATGKKWVAVSLHLHSGIERDEYFIQQIEAARVEGRLPANNEYEQVLNALIEDRTRRLAELRVLIANLKTLQLEQDYGGVILGGDLNFEPDSPEYQELLAAGLKDTYMLASPTNELHSYDPKQNPLARHEEVTLPPTLSAIIRTLSEAQQQQIIAAYREGIGEARRIDFIFATRWGAVHPRGGCLRQELFGQPDAVNLGVGSDHYGVLDTYRTDSTNC
jgi:endonuclease/exonuclease/phosphatase family metal-dependent hydrolase